MSIVSRITGKIFKLPPADTYNIIVERGLEVPMADGVVLLADHYYPRGSVKLPTVLIRCPYGRGSLYGLIGRLFAERGFQVLFQSCRGTFGSGGQFSPFRTEQADGLATIEWMKNQEWFSGEFATTGGSYLGYVQWAIARDAGPELKAIAPQITASEFHSMLYCGGSFTLLDCITWANIVHSQEKSSLASLSAMRAGRKLEPAFKHLPLRDADSLVVGEPVQFWQDWLEHSEPDDEWWKSVDHSGSVADVTVPVNLAGGWYDIFLPWMIRDYAILKNAGREPYLTIGPWSHLSMGMLLGDSQRESIAWLRAHLLGDRSLMRESPVHVYVMGTGEWRDFPEWPPPGYQPQRWYLRSEGVLTPELPVESDPDNYRYDPSDPTPNIGGAIMNSKAGSKDNRILEARPDVLVYTSAVLSRDLELIGPVQAELFVKSSLEYTDFFVRLCDVHPSGKSFNICDGILRLRPGSPAPEKDGTIKLNIEMWPTAYHFTRGHRLRLQVSSGAHPRFARNPGTGEPLGAGTSFRTADQTVYHDPAHPSAVILPAPGSGR
jgi:putative CocE/NonD family hydrolase